jgi:hypothetical protein
MDMPRLKKRVATASAQNSPRGLLLIHRSRKLRETSIRLIEFESIRIRTRVRVTNGTGNFSELMTTDILRPAVLNAESVATGIRLGRLGWSLRRIEGATGVRRETAGGYLRLAGIALRTP